MIIKCVISRNPESYEIRWRKVTLARISSCAYWRVEQRDTIKSNTVEIRIKRRENCYCAFYKVIAKLFKKFVYIYIRECVGKC